METQDLNTYNAIGKKGEELTGYPAISVYHDFAYDPKTSITGTFDDWMYEQLGVYAWTTEIWSLQRQAGLTDYKYIEWFRTHPPEHDLQILRWADENLDEGAYVDWYEFEHPQLGKVELGGWHNFLTWRNPPYQMLEKEIAPLADFALFHCLASPKLEVYQLDVASHGDIHHVRLVLENTGWLPTNVSKQAVKMGAVKPLEVDLILPEGVTLVSGEAKSFLGQLAGWDHTWVASFGGGDGTDNRKKVEWVMQGQGEVEIVARHDRAGVVKRMVRLGIGD
jgi:hypothetical protein